MQFYRRQINAEAWKGVYIDRGVLYMLSTQMLIYFETMSIVEGKEYQNPPERASMHEAT